MAAIKDFALHLLMFELLDDRVPSIKPLKVSEFDDIIQAHDVAFIFVYDAHAKRNEKDTPYSVVHQAAKEFKNTIGSIYICPDPAGFKKLGIEGTAPTLIVVKDGGIMQDQFRGSLNAGPMSLSVLKTWVENTKNPLVTKLTDDNSKIVFAKEILVLGIVNPDKVDDLKKLRLIAKDWYKMNPESKISFAWLDAFKYQNYIQRVYKVSMTSLPTLIITQPSQEAYYDQLDSKAIEFESAYVFKMLELVQNGTIMPKSSRGFLGSVYQTVKFQLKGLTSGWTLLQVILLFAVILIVVYGLFFRKAGKKTYSFIENKMK